MGTKTAVSVTALLFAVLMFTTAGMSAHAAIGYSFLCAMLGFLCSKLAKAWFGK